MTAVRLSVVIASKDRPQLVRRALGAVVTQLAPYGDEAEIVIVDDGSTPPYDAATLAPATVIRGPGEGPARARNRGVALAVGEIVLFLDDDVVPEPGWAAAALAVLSGDARLVGVTGDTTAGDHDPIYEHAVADHVGGSFLTCNVAYRRSALLAVGGFDERFRRAHEDRDLAYRVTVQVGPVGFAPQMRVVHPGRLFTVRQAWARATLDLDDWLFFDRYPEQRSGGHAPHWLPLRNAVRTWRDVSRGAHLGRRPRAALRFAAIAGGLALRLAWRGVVRWPAARRRDPAPAPGLRTTWRFAYLGPSPDPRAGGAPGVAGLLLGELLARGHEVTCYVAASVEDDDPRALGEREGLRYVIGRSGFRFGRLYSRTRLTKMASSQLFAAVARRRLARALGRDHARRPYDFAYQFSTFETFGVPRRRDLPVVIHPSVHAAGERRWLRAESALGLSDDGAVRRAFVSAWLTARAVRQRRDAHRAAGVLALSAPFAAAIGADYDLDPTAMAVVPNCVDVDGVAVGTTTEPTLVAVGRIVQRKGLEDVAALSRRLAKDHAALTIEVIGTPSLWSDYRRALRTGDPATLHQRGPLPRAAVFDEVRRATALLQLSRYEPFGLTVAEALALGVPVIVTPAVGAAAFVADDVKVTVAPGDVDALATAVASVAALRDDERALLRGRCRQEAVAHFSPHAVADAWEAGINRILRGTSVGAKRPG